MGTTSGNDPEIKKFFQQVSDIRELIDTISENTIKIEQLYNASLAAARDEDVTSFFLYFFLEIFFFFLKKNTNHLLINSLN